MPNDNSISFPNPLNYNYAYELIAEIKQFGGFCIAGACYPECHPDCKSMEQNIEHLKVKIENGCDFFISQLFFDNTKMYEFMDKLHTKNINVPIEAGIMPITNPKQIKRMVDLSGSSIPKDFRAMLNKYSEDTLSLKQAGIEFSLKQIEGLISYGIDGIHIYTMNKPDIAEKIINGISL